MMRCRRQCCCIALNGVLKDSEGKTLLEKLIEHEVITEETAAG